MKKIILLLFFGLFGLAVFGLPWLLSRQISQPAPQGRPSLAVAGALAAPVVITATAPERTATARPACLVVTGLEGGAVNIRSCAGVTCPVIDLAREGERLTIITLGEWVQVETKTGAPGWVNSAYCEVGK
jgi:hypothetical protein